MIGIDIVKDSRKYARISSPVTYVQLENMQKAANKVASVTSRLRSPTKTLQFPATVNAY